MFFLQFRDGVDHMEKGALIGMVALAFSDLMFCLITLCDKYLLEDSLLYRTKNASFFFTMYGSYLENTLIKTFTWFTVIMAIGRYLAVSYPLKARQHLRAIYTTVAIICGVIFWILFYLPLIWTLQVLDTHCASETVHLLTTGKFMEQVKMRMYLTYAWAVSWVLHTSDHTSVR